MFTNSTTLKRCSSCKIEKPRTEFHRDARKPDGLAYQCKTCRGTKTPRGQGRPKHITPHLHIWRSEFELVCACIVCDGTPLLPETVETIDAARDYLLTHAPRCERHQNTVLPTRARLRERRWFETAHKIVTTIDTYHDITVMLRTFRETRKVKGAKEWLGGKRDGLEETMIDFVQDWCIERTCDQEIVARMNETAPTLATHNKEAIYANEVSLEYIEKCRRTGENDDYNSVLDL